MVRKKPRKESAEKTAVLLDNAEETYRMLIENINDVLLTLDPQGNITYISPVVEQVSKYRVSDLTGKPFSQLIYPDDLPALSDRFTRLLSGQLEPWEFRILDKDGGVIFVRTSSWPLLENGQVVGITTLMIDITDRKTAEELQRSEHIMLARTEQIANIGSWEWDIATDTVTWSDELFRIFQRDPQEGAPSFAEHPAFYHPDDMARLRQAVEAAVADGLPYELEMRAIRKDGETRNCVARGVTEMGPGGRPVRLVGSLQDITERKQQEEKLRKSEQLYHSLFDNMLNGFAYCKMLFDNDQPLDWIYLSVNSAFEKQTGLKNVIGKKVTEVIPGIYKADPHLFEIYGRVALTGIPETMETYSSALGEWLSISIYSPEREYFVAVFDVITKRKLSEEKLEKSYKSLQKNLHDAINTMVKIVEMRDPYTSGHQQKVADLATAIAGEMKLDDTRVDQLRMSALIHDIGKMYVPSDILSKPGKLAKIEFDLIKTHAQGGYDIVKSMDLPCSVANTVLQHHERLDGSGYPNHLKGEDTILEAKILAVADVVEAMISHRPYRPALGIDKTLEEISKNRGILYDPGVVDTCLELFNSGMFEFK